MHAGGHPPVGVQLELPSSGLGYQDAGGTVPAQAAFEREAEIFNVGWELQGALGDWLLVEADGGPRAAG
eukprot:4717246-Alexandrium_andersonii.AAC.1